MIEGFGRFLLAPLISFELVLLDVIEGFERFLLAPSISFELVLLDVIEEFERFLLAPSISFELVLLDVVDGFERFLLAPSIISVFYLSCLLFDWETHVGENILFLGPALLKTLRPFEGVPLLQGKEYSPAFYT